MANNAAALVRELRRAGFAVSVSSERLASIIASASAQQRDESSAALARADSALQGTGRALYPFQREGVRWLSSRSQGLLGDEMGLGKTVQALLSVPAAVPVIVLCPAAVKFNWRAEIAAWRPDLECDVLQGRASWRFPTPGEVVVLNPDILPPVDPASLFAPSGVVLIVDEAHQYKAGKSQRTIRLRNLSAAVLRAGGKVWLMTGTPIINRPSELWNVLRCAALEKIAFGSWPNFMRLFGAYQGRFGIVWGNASAEVPELLRRVMLRRERLAVLPDLPAKTRSTLTVNGMPAALKRDMDKFLAKLQDAGITLEAVLSEGASGQERKLLFEELSRLGVLVAAAKVPAVIEMIEDYEDAGEPVVVFSAHRLPIDTISDRPGWAAITGDTPADKRQDIVQRFQAGELHGIAATIQAAGIGLTLTRACHALFVDRAWTPAENTQAEDRICRIGQTRPCVIRTVVLDHALDARIAELLSEKQALVDSAVSAASATSVHEDEEPRLEVSVMEQNQIAAPAKTSAPLAAPVKRMTTLEDVRGNALRTWIGNSLLELARLDTDRAAVINGVGFSRLDSGFGASLAQALVTSGLTERQWTAAHRLLTRYHRQIGRAPTEG